MAGVERRLFLGGLAALAGCGSPDAGATQASGTTGAAPVDVVRSRLPRLIAAYPDHLARPEGDTLVWTDGTRMPIGTGQPARPFAEMLASATIADQLRQTYEPGPMTLPPPRDHSPGRLRNTAFFLKMYGDCRQGDTALHLRPVTWMPRTRPQTLRVTTVNDVASRLERVIDALEAMPDRFRAYLVPSAGTYNCRAVADTGLPSVHGFGAAIDIAVRQSDYWAWTRTRGDIAYRNRIPPEIVEVFEAERFIWGGKWYHYDTMHFEYRPELFA
ncbi:M15 family metallopeptidase [Roseomonas sp. HJA6]|uniref:M15 family metallopeptidase n=1 Tax=Roseomonas alba TaxID=2846776 RepID=A0ABS7AFP9_9PROT|nr:M15 family metallopeptidase [Neoroseomonas alba]MBW6401136.1 M15 family metallopeptidase [Neoroseomonas alba]